MKTFLSFISVGILITTYIIGFIPVMYIGLSLSVSVGIISEVM